MFAPTPASSQNGTAAGMVTRSRRRQRPHSSDNSLSQPKSKRLRSDRPQVTDQTFAEPAAAAPETYEVKALESTSVENRQDGIEPSFSASRRELAVRSKKGRAGDRVHKGDPATFLSTNDGFDVRKLPVLPERLSIDTTSRQHGYVDSARAGALVLTHTHAVAWGYTAPSMSALESFTFTLPHPSKNSTDPLPLGSLVSPSASSHDYGLVIVMPTSGRITYWESISSATTLNFIREQRTGVEDTISGISSGEHVIQLVNLEAASGFVLAFSSGRMAYMSVRDLHGRPKISVQFLRCSLGPSTGGFFGSLRKAFPSIVQGDIAAVRADRSTKQAECTVIAATSKGRIHSWRIHRGGHHDVLTDVDTRGSLIKAIQKADETSRDLAAESLKIIDFCFVPKGISQYADMSLLRTAQGVGNRQHILLLTSLDNGESRRYHLVEMMVPNAYGPETGVEIGMVRTISCYYTPPSPHALVKPRIYLPKPAVIAFLVFDHAAVVASIAQPPVSPDSQIMQDNDTLPPPFEDVIDIRDDSTLEIVGSGFEEPQIYDPGEENIRDAHIKTKNPVLLLLSRGAGAMRVSVRDYPRFATTSPPKVTAKGKLEQAVFFGHKENNPLVFGNQHGIRFSNEEYGAAALQLSEEILTSAGPHLASVAASLDANIKDRVQYLGWMMSHLKTLGVDLDRRTKWRLLWNAEKMHVASTLWRKHEEFLRMRPAGSMTIAAETVECIRAEEKSTPDPERGETDELRHWFIHDVNRMELFIAWGYQVVKTNSMLHKDNAATTRLIYEASDMYNSTIRAAFDFRQANLELYGLGQEKLVHGILEGHYAGLPTPWTSDKFIANNLKRQVELITYWMKDHPAQSEETKALMEKTREILPELTATYLSVLQELARWDLASDDPKDVEEGERFQEVYEKDRHDKVILLYESDNPEAAIKLAEVHRSLPALAEVLTRQIHGYRKQLSNPALSPSQSEALEDKMDEKEMKVKECFTAYGEEFAFPLYDYIFDTYGVDALLNYAGDKVYKTKYLRSKPQLAKISWINDVVEEEDIDHAADTLLELGLAREQQIWNKKIQLSLSKLARMADASSGPQKVTMSDLADDARLNVIDKELTVINIQNEFYNTQVYPLISVALDESEELGLVKEAFALKYPKKFKIIHQLFEDGIRRLLKHEALDPLTLIDLLTLAHFPLETRDAVVDQFFLALQVAYNGIHSAPERVPVERLIWRRCYLREDWSRVNETGARDDATNVDVLGETELYQVYCTLSANGESTCPILRSDLLSNHRPDQDMKGKKHVEFRRLLPSNVLGVYTKTLDRRFSSMDEGYQNKVLEVMRWEDAALRKQMEKYRLEDWAKATKDLADAAVQRQYDDATEHKSATANFIRSLPLKKSLAKLAEASNGRRNGLH
ncbi:Non-repetitive/WGA-negative nucleoporin C-terminal-domain-containing protein [Xylariaceae sp. FL0594]|nr:Non-repetitive/WGA-negative nucleoporin C-terminal-domain-containing protein [Xylariaceae sp. FL0594]